MRKMELLKRLILLLLAASLAFAALPALAQEEGETAEEGQTTEEVEAEHEEEGGLLTPLGINTGLMVAQVVNFLLMAGILTAFVWKPAVNMLDERSQNIQKGLEDAAAAAKARENAEAEADKILQEARSEKQQILAEAREQGEQVQNQMEREAQQEADRIRQEAREEAQTEKAAELAKLRDQVIQISTAVASRIVEAELTDEKQRELVSDFFSDLPEGAKKLSGNVTVVSAMPLTDSEKEKIESETDAENYTYEVDPEILGGLILRSPDRIVDGSVRGSLGNLTSRLK